MLERICNILIIESNPNELLDLLQILRKPGNNIFTAETNAEALEILETKEISIVMLDLDGPQLQPYEIIRWINSRDQLLNINIIVTSLDSEKLYDTIDHSKKGAVDYLVKPFQEKLVTTKIGVYKYLSQKQKRVSRLLENILPEQTLKEFQIHGKSSPKKHQNATVLFTDFVRFSEITRDMNPDLLIQKLDYYFTKFDEIIRKYHLEKIKTIGDAYMAVGGVTEKKPFAAIRTALAAIEIQHFMHTEKETAKALGREYWEIRIGIHTGPLVAGVVGKHKFSFDVWGDTVNVAARCEQTAEHSTVNISVDFREKIQDYFECEHRGQIAIKNRGEIGMYILKRIKPEHSFYGKGVNPNQALRSVVDLPKADFEGLRVFILNKLKAELDDNLFYHSYNHTLNVEEAIIKYAQLENLKKEELTLCRTAALFHDSGFLVQYDNNEEIGIRILKKYAPDFGYDEADIEVIAEMIKSTSNDIEPKNLMQEIMCDSDHDYLGRADYHVIAAKLFKEKEAQGHKMTEREQIEAQIDYLENKHQYYTTSAINLRKPGKELRIAELKRRLQAVEAS
ncbi:MAG: adenylate/guanylate cyclase domain-containing protein [Crocinitomicaceae bacterium]